MLRLMWSLAILGICASLGACADPLFPKDTPRTPYERYQVLHGQQSPTAQSAIGLQNPNLRQRLRPLEQ